jgi:hypothetical protein
MLFKRTRGPPWAAMISITLITGWVPTHLGVALKGAQIIFPGGGGVIDTCGNLSSFPAVWMRLQPRFRRSVSTLQKQELYLANLSDNADYRLVGSVDQQYTSRELDSANHNEGLPY